MNNTDLNLLCYTTPKNALSVQRQVPSPGQTLQEIKSTLGNSHIIVPRVIYNVNNQNIARHLCYLIAALRTTIIVPTENPIEKSQTALGLCR